MWCPAQQNAGVSLVCSLEMPVSIVDTNKDALRLDQNYTIFSWVVQPLSNMAFRPNGAHSSLALLCSLLFAAMLCPALRGDPSGHSVHLTAVNVMWCGLRGPGKSFKDQCIFCPCLTLIVRHTSCVLKGYGELAWKYEVWQMHSWGISHWHLRVFFIEAQTSPCWLKVCSSILLGTPLMLPRCFFLSDII